jgi:hypothetical protein
LSDDDDLAVRGRGKEVEIINDFFFSYCKMNLGSWVSLFVVEA